jgi:hypothetical protein
VSGRLAERREQGSRERPWWFDVLFERTEADRDT